MSAFFIGSDSMQRVIAGFIANYADPGHGLPMPTKLGRELLKMNRQAMLARYPSIKGTAEDLAMLADCETFDYDSNVSCQTVDDVETAYEQTRSLRYQCSEGDVPDENPLYAVVHQQVERMESRLKEARAAAASRLNAKVEKFYRDNGRADYWDMTAVAKLLRKILRESYPSVTFSVRQRSRGSSLNISWTNGPAAAEVEAIVNHLRVIYGRDGLDKIEKTILTIGGKPASLASLKYVFCYREVTKGYVEAFKKAFDQMPGQARCDLMNKFPAWRDELWCKVGVTPALASQTLASVEKVTIRP